VISAVTTPIAITPTDAFLLVLLGIFPTAVAYFLWYEAASEISTVAAALLFTLTVVFTFANAAIFLGEAITTPMVIGGALIVAGVLLSKLRVASG
jgi:DME family drug/metabolite transporter